MPSKKLLVFPFFFLAGLLTAFTSFVFQILLSDLTFLNSTGQLFLFVFLEESLRLVYWKEAWQISLFSTEALFFKILSSSLFFGGGFWFLELIFLKLKTTTWQISLPGLTLLLIHLILSIIIANAGIKFIRKDFLAFFWLFSLALAIHFAYNWTIEKSLSCQEQKAVIECEKILKNNLNLS